MWIKKSLPMDGVAVGIVPPYIGFCASLQSQAFVDNL